MPNWCKGDLKIRGRKENIVRFLSEGLIPIAFSCLIPVGETTVERCDDCFKINLQKDNFFKIKGARQFIETNEITFWFPEEDDTPSVFVLGDYSGAWTIDSAALAALSAEFGVDFKIYGFERGMEFNQDVEVVNGEIVKDDEIHFDDYVWECPFPEIGG